MKKAQKSYQFTLELKNVDANTADLEDSLYEAGCNDALIYSRNGSVYLDFDRLASSFEAAITSAINHCEAATLHAIVTRVAPDNLVTEAEIAKRLGKGRQTISLWIKGERKKNNPFPKPTTKLTDRSPLWNWCEIVDWLYQDLKVEKEQVDQAHLIEDINAMLTIRNTHVTPARQAILEKINAKSALS